MRVFLVRHGETRHNAEGRIQGAHLDDPLNETGRAQAQALHRHFATERLRGLNVAAVYTSPLRRASETARAIADALEVPEPVALPGLREISWGLHNGALNVGPVSSDVKRVLTSWETGDLGASVLGGETPGDAWERAIKELAPVFARHERDDIICVAHGRMNKIIMSGLVHGHLHHMERYPQANAGINVLTGPFPWLPVVINQKEHLGTLRTLDERSS